MPKKNQTIIIIHNLKTNRTKKQVEAYIDEILFKSVTFKVRKGDIVTSKQGNIKDGVFFTEPNNNNECSVFHLLFSADGSEVGDYYNQFEIDFIEEKYKSDLKIKQFDVIA